jgi:hypothetical protein
MAPARVLLSLVVLGALSACSDQGPTVPEHGAALARRSGAAAATQERPAGGRCEFSFVRLPPTPDQPPNVTRFHLDLLCHLRHLGRTVGSAEQTVTFTPPATNALTITITYTAANGDQLFATFSGTASFTDPTTIVASGTERYTGGTGRFAGASGSAALAGSASFVTSTGFYETRGQLRY